MRALLAVPKKELDEELPEWRKRRPKKVTARRRRSTWGDPWSLKSRFQSVVSERVFCVIDRVLSCCVARRRRIDRAGPTVVIQ